MKARVLSARLQPARALCALFALGGVSGCCGRDAPTWLALEPVVMAPDVRQAIALGDKVADDRPGLSFVAEPEPGVLASVDQEGTLTLLSESGFTGASSVHLIATDACGNVAETDLKVTVGVSGGRCVETVTYAARGAGTGQVFIAGAFNEWNASATPMTSVGGGAWSVDLSLSPGAWPYKLVEVDYTAGTEQWACDPDSDFMQCDEGYSWDAACTPGGPSCNSMLMVPDCSLPTLDVTSLRIDRELNTVSVTVDVPAAKLALISTAAATLDGGAVDAWTGSGFQYTASNLSDGRHALDFSVTTTDGRTPTPVHIPFWTDDATWQNGLMYYVFVDRFHDGDQAINVSEGTSAASADYDGGDWRGVIDKMDYLEDLGVTVIWLTAPQDNPSGAFGGSCNATYSGYHGYWPAEPFACEGHFGDSDTLHELVTAAHARNMRVITDWVANHVEENHPYYAAHPEWFNPLALCGDADNWNDIPETCWFDTFLPDVNYYKTEPLVQLVDDSMVWAREYDLDGYRVDAVKHMAHSVFRNFGGRVQNEIEFTDAGGDEDFYTVGETYSGDQTLINSYIGPENGLDAQFDFPLYWAIVAAFGRDEIGLSNGEGSLQSVRAATATAFAGHTMSTFLGNHDVARFIAQASGEISSLYGDSACGSDGSLRTPDTPPGWSEPYDRLRLAWTFLLTSEGLPLIYYGDEIGMPGYNDPDNRQVMRFGDDLSADEGDVLAHVQLLGQARRGHPAMSTGRRVDWWEGEGDVWAYAREVDGDEVIVLLNRSDTDRTLSNGLAFAGLSGARYSDVLSGETFTAEGDNLTVALPAMSSRVLVLTDP